MCELEDRDFEWVFDSCAYTPDAVSKLLDVVGVKLKRYVLISSISAYGTFDKCGLAEDDPAPSASLDDLAIASRIPNSKRSSAFAYGSSYGPLKRACEIAAKERLGHRATALRVGLLVGAGDYTDRLTWWVRRIDEACGDQRRIPAPGPTSRIVQLIDVRDAANFSLHCAECDAMGEWNVTGNPVRLSYVLDEVVRIAESRAEIIWIDENRVLEAGITPWTDMPLMAPVAPEFRHFLEVDNEHAKAAGLQCRPLEETLGPLLAWDRSRRSQSLKGGLTLAQESLLLT